MVAVTIFRTIFHLKKMMKLLVNIILRILSVIPKDKQMNRIFFYLVVKGIVFGDNRFSNMFVLGTNKHFRSFSDLDNGFLSCGSKLFNFFASPFYKNKINDVAKGTFGIGCPKHFLYTHWLYFFITSSCEVSCPLLA